MVTNSMTIEEAIEQYDPDDATYIIQITERGWHYVPRKVSQWLAQCPQLVNEIPMYTMGDPCD